MLLLNFIMITALCNVPFLRLRSYQLSKRRSVGPSLVNSPPHWQPALHRHLVELRCAGVWHHFLRTICSFNCIIDLLFYHLDLIDYPQWRGLTSINYSESGYWLRLFELTSLFHPTIPKNLLRLGVDNRCVVLLRDFFFNLFVIFLGHVVLPEFMVKIRQAVFVMLVVLR